MDIEKLDKQANEMIKTLLDGMVDQMALNVNNINRDVSSKIMSEITLIREELKREKTDHEYINSKIDLIGELGKAL